LTNAFAVYEQWADELMLALGEPANSGKKLQFPDRPWRSGAESSIVALTANESATNKSAFYPVLCSSTKYDFVRLPNLLACYRYFKELRNAEVHAGGVANAHLVEVFADFQPVSTKADLGLNGDLIYEPAVLGQVTLLHLRGVVGFTDVLLRLMITFDAELSRFDKAEAVLKTALRAATSGASLMPGNPTLRNNRIRGLCRTAKLPRPVDPAIVYSFMVQQRLLRV
jgi:hypothetical protein